MKKCILITGGGTGGHLYPGIALAHELEKKDKNIDIVFIGSNRGIESRLLTKEKYKYHLLNIGPLNNVSKVRKLLSLLQLLPSMLHSLFLIFKYRPVHIIGFGGYASGPLMLAGILSRRKCSLWEGNARAGLVTRNIAKFMRFNFLAFESKDSCYPEPTKRVIGVPVRNLQKIEKSPATGNANLNIFAFGGSQGAMAINKVIFELQSSKDYAEFQDQFRWIHQVGSIDFSKPRTKERSNENYEVVEFVYDMQEKYNWADLVICRSGASTLAEISQMGLASILIPLPSAADDHQKKNAEQFEELGAAKIIEQKNLSKASLLEAILEIAKNPSLLAKMQEASKSLAKKDAAAQMANAILED